MDDETRSALQQLAGDAAKLPPALHGRLRGESVSELKRDAEAFARDLFGEPERPRDDRGRFSGGTQAINAEIRRRAGRLPAVPEPPPIGDAGIGRGASAVPRTRPQPTMNSLIRSAHAGRRSVAHQFAEQIAMEEAS